MFPGPLLSKCLSPPLIFVPIWAGALAGDEGPWRQRISRTSGLYVVVMFLYTVWESDGVFYVRSRFLCFKQPIKKNGINSKTLCPQSASFILPRPRRQRRQANIRQFVITI